MRDRYSHFVEYFSFVDLNLASFLSASCAVQPNHYSIMLGTSAGPIGLCVLIGVYCVVRTRLKGDPDGSLHARCFAWFLFITYLVFPGTSSTLFQTFMKDEDFDGSACYLEVDYSIKCNTPAYRAWSGYAGLMILVFPIGIPLTYGILLWRHRKDLNPDPRQVADALLASEVSDDDDQNDLRVLARAANDAHQLVDVERKRGIEMHAKARAEQQTKELDEKEQEVEYRRRRPRLSAVALKARTRQELSSTWQEAFPVHAAYVSALEHSASVLDSELVHLHRDKNTSVAFLSFLWGACARCVAVARAARAFSPVAPLSPIADDRRWYLWECIECLRRLTLTGMLVFVEPGKISQVIAAAFVALAWLSLYGVLQPFKATASDKASTTAQYMIFVQLFIGVLIKADVVAEAVRTVLTWLLVSMNLTPGATLFFSLIGDAAAEEVAEEQEGDEEEPACEIQVADVELVQSAEHKSDDEKGAGSATQKSDDEQAAEEAPPATTDLGIGFEMFCST